MKGLNCCSDSFISFHYMSPSEMYHLDTAFKIQTKRAKQNNKLVASFKDIFESYVKLGELEDIVNDINNKQIENI